MSCKELVVVLLAVAGCRDRCEVRGSPPEPASKVVEAVSEQPPAQSAQAVQAPQSTEPAEPPEAQPPPAPPLPRAQVAPPVAAEPRPRPQVAEVEVQPPPPPPEQQQLPERRPFEEYYPRHEELYPPQVPPAPVQIFPQAMPQYNDAGVLVPAVPLWIDPSAEPGSPGNGAPDPRHPNP